MLYKAFISYSHAADGKLAPALQSALHRFAKPWYRLRAAHVFRDKTSLSLNPALWPSIESALRDSEYFLLLASPEAASSKWVEQEIDSWLAHSTAARILIILTDGELRWNVQQGRFDPESSTALPASLRDAFDQEPLHLDMRWAKTGEQLSLRNPRYREAIAEIAATLYNRPKDELIGEDIRQYKRTRRWMWSAIVMLIALTTASLIAAIIAFQQRNLAALQRNLAVARQLTSQAQFIEVQQGRLLETGVLLAVESLKRFHDVGRVPLETNQTLRHQLSLLPVLLVRHEPNHVPERVILSDDGEYLATLDRQRTAVHVRDARNGGELHALVPGHEVERILFGGEKKVVAAAGRNVVTVWDAASGKQLSRIEHPNLKQPIAFSTDGSLMATVEEESTGVMSQQFRVRLWRTQGGREIAVSFMHPKTVHDIAFSPDGEHIATASGRGAGLLPSGRPRWDEPQPFPLMAVPEDDSARVWNIASGTEVSSVQHANYVRLVTFSADGRLAASAGADKTVVVWKVKSGDVLARLVERSVPGRLAFSPNGEFLSTGAGFSLLEHEFGASLWEVKTGREISRLDHDAGIASLTFSWDSRYVITASFDGTARVWYTANGREVARLVHPVPVVAGAIEKGTRHVITAGDDGSANIWSFAERPDRSHVGNGSNIGAFDFSPDGRYLATVQMDSSLRLWDASEGIELARVSLDTLPGVVVFDPSGKRLATIDSQGTLTIRNATGDLEVIEFMHDKPARTAAFAPDGAAVAIAEKEHAVRLVSLSGAQHVLNLPPGDPVLAVAYSPEGSLVATGSESGSVRLWDVGTQRITLPVSHSSRVSAIEFTSNGRHMVSASEEGTVLVTDIETSEEVQRISHGPSLRDIAVSPEGSHLVTVGMESYARVWDLSNGRETARLEHDSDLTGAAFTPDGRHIVTSTGGPFRGEHHPLRFWVWRPQDLIEAACSRLSRNLGRDEWRRYLNDEPYRPTCVESARTASD